MASKAIGEPTRLCLSARMRMVIPLFEPVRGHAGPANGTPEVRPPVLKQAAAVPVAALGEVVVKKRST
ncbi:hypothetical protein ABZ915_22660 [Streptomyces sp. NPDC046915]|uniref:hypothetical protein n=1 Tax=Streptomyces sp. NPDC046915 TaxID=3155257 RepID=UPI0034014178